MADNMQSEIKILEFIRIYFLKGGKAYGNTATGFTILSDTVSCT